MNKLIATAALGFCATLSAMENTDNTIVLKTPSAQVLRKAFKKSEFEAMDINTNLSLFIGNQKIRKTSLYNCVQQTLCKYNHSYKQPKLDMDAKKLAEMIESVSIIQTPTRDSKLTKVPEKKITKLRIRQTSKDSWVARL